MKGIKYSHCGQRFLFVFYTFCGLYVTARKNFVRMSV